MIPNGCGIISVPVEHQPDFRKMLVEFYESGESQCLSGFMYDNCIDGMEFEYKNALVKISFSSQPKP
jgi:hypothetical protein